MKNNKFQYGFFFFLLLPNVQQLGFTIYNIKVVLHFLFSLVLVLSFLKVEMYRANNSVKISNLLTFFLPISIVFILSITAIPLLYGLDNLYFYIKFISGLFCFYYVLFAKESFDPILWRNMITISILLALLQQFLPTRFIFMYLWGSVQGVNSDWPYSRASGLTSHFYIYTQFMCLCYIVFNLHNKLSDKNKLIIGISSLLSNTKSAIIFPIWLLFLNLKTWAKFMFLILGGLVFVYASIYFAPIRVIYSHLHDVYTQGNFEPIINSHYSSFSQRMDSIFYFFALFSDRPFMMTFFGLGTNYALGQEIGYFYIITSVGLIFCLIYYLMPLLVLYKYIGLYRFFSYLLMLIPLFISEFLVTGLVKYELYVLYWMSIAFIIKKETN